MSYFFSENDIGNVTDSVLWESLKAVIREDIIYFEIRKNKEDIEHLITELETDYKSKLCPHTLKKIVSLRGEYNSFLSKKQRQSNYLTRLNKKILN